MSDFPVSCPRCGKSIGHLYNDVQYHYYSQPYSTRSWDVVFKTLNIDLECCAMCIIHAYHGKDEQNSFENANKRKLTNFFSNYIIIKK